MNRVFCHLLFIALFLAPSSEASTKPFTNKESYFFKADKIYYNSEEGFAEAIGDVQIINGNQYLSADRALIDVRNKKIWTNGYIYGETTKQKMLADSLFIDKKNNTALAKNVKLQLSNNDVVAAELLLRKNEDETDIFKGSYTPCNICYNDKPLWQIDAETTSLDFKNKTITYRNGSFKIAGYRVVYFPYFSHPMPDSPSESGILRPEIDKGTLKIPLYFSLKPNMDITYTPRFNRRLFIHELEYRHLIENGTYQFNGSYLRSRILKQFENGENIDKKYHRYYISSVADFKIDHTHYGYDLSQVSDKSYLKNYYQDPRSYLKSEIYLNQFEDNGYNHFDLQHYQGLRKDDIPSKAPNALPNIVIKRDYELNNGINFQIYDKGLEYIEGNTKSVIRNSFGADLSKTFFGSQGQSVTTSFHNRTDFYKLQKIRYLNNKQNTNKDIARNIPEVKTDLRWPLFLTGDRTVTVIEPEMSFVLGKNKIKEINNHSLTDSPNYEINENNIFEYSRYSGIDYYESGRRFSYGVNNYLMGENWQVGGFLGQLIRSNIGTSSSKSDYIGKISYNFQDIVELYYRFQKKEKTLQPYRDEISAWLNLGKFSLQNNWTSLRDLREFSGYYDLSNSLNKNIIKQNYSVASYKITDNLTLFGDLRLDFSNKNNTKVISDGLGATYNVDCVSFSVRVSNDYMSDPTINIKKTRSYGIKLGLKTLNM